MVAAGCAGRNHAVMRKREGPPLPRRCAVPRIIGHKVGYCFKSMGQGRGGVVLPVRSVDGFWEEPFTFTGVTPPPVIPAETDFDMFNTLISASDFQIRFHEGVLIDCRNTRNVSGFYVLPDPKALCREWLRSPRLRSVEYAV
jgi:hypothetical protein